MPVDWALVSHCVKKITENIMSKTDIFRKYPEKSDEKCLGLKSISLVRLLLFYTVHYGGRTKTFYNSLCI